MEERRSQHPIDVLLRDVISGRHDATEDDVAAIIERMATASFDTTVVPVPLHVRGVHYLDHELGARETSLTLHLAQRVREDRQWVDGTTAEEYVADLRAAVRTPNARLAACAQRGRHIAAALVNTVDVVPPHRRGPDPLPLLFVVYSADRGIMLSGRQASGLHTIRIPENTIWLR